MSPASVSPASVSPAVNAQRAKKATAGLVAAFEALPTRGRREGIPSVVVREPYARNVQQSRVYGAEKKFRQLVRSRSEFPRISLAGVSVDIPDMVRFGDLTAVQRYVDDVVEREGASRVTVTAGTRLAQRAHYTAGKITLPLAGPDHRWAWNAAVVLHEVAHHLTAGARHNSPFPGKVVDLFTLCISPEAGLLMRVLYLQNDVKL